ncbi:hypothetical protein JCM10212_000291 [Sporobolomyces blumeae]
MLSSRMSAVVWSTFAAGVLVLPLVAAQQLADGTYLQSGSINPNLMWQASGVLSKGRCPIDVKISDCYVSQLASSGNLQSTTKPPTRIRRDGLAAYDPANSRHILAAMSDDERRAIADDDDLDSYFRAFPEQQADRYGYVYGGRLGKRQVATCSTKPVPTSTQTSSTATGTTSPGPTTTPTPPPPSPRQRNEFLTWPGAPAGSTWKYTWKSYQSRSTSTTSNFFHAWQILRRDACGGPVVTLDYTDGQVRIQDFARNCFTCAQPLSPDVQYWFGRTISHTLTITYGLSGSMSYAAYSDSNLRRPLITYSATGDMGSSASLKYGNYRAVVSGISAATAYVGDLTQTRLS